MNISWPVSYTHLDVYKRQVPRAALLADELAQEAEFFSFGTNDLTQLTFGFSRDDAGKFLPEYYDAKIYENDPFARLDQKGVGKLIEMAVTLGRQTRPDIKLGICGEHGGCLLYTSFSFLLAKLLIYDIICSLSFQEEISLFLNRGTCYNEERNGEINMDLLYMFCLLYTSCIGPETRS